MAQITRKRDCMYPNYIQLEKYIVMTQCMSERVAVCLWCKSRKIILSQPELVAVCAGYNFAPISLYAVPRIFFITARTSCILRKVQFWTCISLCSAANNALDGEDESVIYFFTLMICSLCCNLGRCLEL